MTLPATWVWTLFNDYWQPPWGEALIGPNDLHLPIGDIYWKVTNGTTAMLTEEQCRQLRDIYYQQNSAHIALAWWTVPRGFDPDSELKTLLPALRVHPRLIIDFERGEHFWQGPLNNVKPYIEGLALMEPRPWLALCYDPRQPWPDLGREFWLPHIDAYMPMCYWTDFQGQGQWADPAGCVQAAYDRCQTGKPIIFILPGNEPDSARFRAGLEQALELGDVSIWRRGITTADNWRVLGAMLARRLGGERDDFAYRILDTAVLLAKAVRRLSGESINQEAG